MLARAKRLNGLRRMQKNGSRDVNRVHRGIGEGCVECGPDASIVRRGLCRITRDQAIQAASRLGLNRGNDATDGNIADSNYDPVQHRLAIFNTNEPLPAWKAVPTL